MNEKELKTLQIIKDYREEAEENGGFFVAFSGGKDSAVLLDLFKKSGVNFSAFYNVTTIDAPENVLFIKKYYPEIKFLLPKLNFFQLCEKNRMLPRVNKRFCCRYLKEYTIKKGVVATGVRKEESAKRAKYFIIQRDYRRKKIIHFRPLLEWTELDIWEYIEKNNLPVNPCYETNNRVGCIFCPFCSTKNLLFNAAKYPKYFNLLKKTIEKLLKDGYLSEFGNLTPDDVWKWWTSKRTAKEFFTQLKLF